MMRKKTSSHPLTMQYVASNCFSRSLSTFSRLNQHYQQLTVRFKFYLENGVLINFGVSNSTMGWFYRMATLAPLFPKVLLFVVAKTSSSHVLVNNKFLFLYIQTLYFLVGREKASLRHLAIMKWILFMMICKSVINDQTYQKQ
jgi:hypothetical protein